MRRLLALVPLLLATPSWSAIAFVQAQTVGSDSTPLTAISATITAAGAGNMIAGHCAWGTNVSGDLSSVSDNAGAGNTYTIVRRACDAVDNECSASFYGYNLSGGPTQIACNFGGSVPYRGIAFEEFSGELTTSSPLDGANEQGQLQATPGTGTDGVKSGAGTLTPSVDGSLIYGGAVDTGLLATGSPRFTAGTNFTKPTNGESNINTNLDVATEYWIQTTATAANASFTTASNDATISFMMIFKPAVSAPAQNIQVLIKG